MSAVELSPDEAHLVSAFGFDVPEVESPIRVRIPGPLSVWRDLDSDWAAVPTEVEEKKR